MNEQVSNIDERLTNALEAAPAVVIPSDFALRVMQQLPEKRAQREVPLMVSPGIARRVAFAAGFVLLAAMLVVSLLAGHSVVLNAVEGSLAVEFILLTAWMSLRPQALR